MPKEVPEDSSSQVRWSWGEKCKRFHGPVGDRRRATMLVGGIAIIPKSEAFTAKG